MLATNEHFASENTDEIRSYSIDQVAAQTGLTKRTLRYYEEVGLLPPTDRTVGNYRRYSDADIQLLEHIKKLRDLLGFSLADIREIMEAEAERDELKVAYRHETDSAAKISQLDRSDELVRRQLNLIEQKMVGLEQMQMTFKATIERHEQIRKKLLDKSSL
ncbi:MAG TPA: MerR family transcriptional regulator [Ktedonobacteraceae bacterium]|nr:MerR family transcriptional regulator [Ktedonobacteraceae bacterium]